MHRIIRSPKIVLSKLTNRKQLFKRQSFILFFTFFIFSKFLDGSFSWHGQDHDHNRVRVVRVRDGVVRVLRDAAQVDVVVVVVVVVDVVVRVGNGVKCQHHEGQKVETVESKIAWKQQNIFLCCLN